MPVRSWAKFSEEFENKPVYTKRQMAEAIEKVRQEYVVNRVVQVGKDVDVALQIIAIHKTPEGQIVKVK